MTTKRVTILWAQMFVFDANICVLLHFEKCFFTTGNTSIFSLHSQRKFVQRESNQWLKPFQFRIMFYVTNCVHWTHKTGKFVLLQLWLWTCLIRYSFQQSYLSFSQHQRKLDFYQMKLHFTQVIVTFAFLPCALILISTLVLNLYIFMFSDRGPS